MESGTSFSSTKVVGVVAFVTVTGLHVIKRYVTRWWSRPKVSAIYIYPIKSCQGIRLESCRVTKRGFEHDRIFMLIDKNNKFVSQRTFPKMALIGTNIVGDVLQVTAPGMRPLCIDLGYAGGKSVCLISDKRLECTVWGDSCDAAEVADCEWFSEFLLGTKSDELRLVRMTDEFKRSTDPTYAPEGQAAFSDGFPFLLLSEESLSYVNSRLKKPVTVLNFRPNIVVNSCWTFAEDTWHRIVFHSSIQPTSVLPMSVVKPCSRCKIPSIDPATGIFDKNNEPTRTMKKFRSGKSLGFQNEDWQEEVFFCQNLDHASQEGGMIHVGDLISILSYQRF